MALSSSAQALYLHLSMNADDDGFCNQVTICMFRAHASTQDLQSLLENRFVYQFESGVIVIKHWRMANALRKDRYSQTRFKQELAMLRIGSNEEYITPDEGDYGKPINEWLPDGCRVVADCLPQVRLGKGRLGKCRLMDGSKEPLSDSPAGKSNGIVSEVIDYLNLKAGTAYRANTKATISLILARHKEGASLEDFKSVIDKKVAEWGGNDQMEQYLRPKTLFAAQNFDSYLGAKAVKVKRIGPNGITYEANAKEEDEFGGTF